MPGHSPPRGHTAGWPELGPPGLTPHSLCPGMGLGRAGLLTGIWMPVIWTTPVSSHCSVRWGTSISFPLVSSRSCKESPTLDSCLRPCSIREDTGERTGLLSHSGMCRVWVRGPVSALVTPRVDLHPPHGQRPSASPFPGCHQVAPNGRKQNWLGPAMCLACPLIRCFRRGGGLWRLSTSHGWGVWQDRASQALAPAP